MNTTTKDNEGDIATARQRELRQLNEEYVSASLAGDVEWFRVHLADDFVCIESDGNVHSRESFLRASAAPSDLEEYNLDEVDVRFYGIVALVRASGSWVSKSGVRGTSRYIDVYAHMDGSWKAVSAQITRPRE